MEATTDLPDTSYGCTYPNCDYTFDDKDEWWRHEGSHVQLEVTVCMQCVHERAKTIWAFYTKESWENHASTHKENSPEGVCLGRDYQKCFWCGFCEAGVPLNEMRNERLEHIAAHYEKGTPSSEWLCYREQCFKGDGRGSQDIEDRESEVTEIWATDLIEIRDMYGRTLQLPAHSCSTLESTRAELLKRLPENSPRFDFYVGRRMLVEDEWNDQVTSETTLTLYQQIWNPPPPQPPRPEYEKLCQPLSNISEMSNSSGFFCLPFTGCNRTFHLQPYSASEASQSIIIYRSLRERGAEDRWCDLAGNPVAGSAAIPFECPSIFVGSLVQGLTNYRESICVLVLRATLRSNHAGGVNGDFTYKWIRYVSPLHLRYGLQEALSSGYSVVALWVELSWSAMIRDGLKRSIARRNKSTTVPTRILV